MQRCGAGNCVKAMTLTASQNVSSFLVPQVLTFEPGLSCVNRKGRELDFENQRVQARDRQRTLRCERQNGKKIERVRLRREWNVKGERRRLRDGLESTEQLYLYTHSPGTENGF